MKTCAKCKTEKEYSFFSKDSSSRDGLYLYCKPCNKIRQTKIGDYYSNAERLEYMNAYFSDPENHEKRKQRDRIKNKERPKEVENALSALRRARKLQATPKWADKQKIAKIYQECVEKTIQTGILHVVDHVIPLRGQIHQVHAVCGLHVETNLEIITKPDNQTKGCVRWPDMP